MLKKFIEGLVFGAGFTISFLILWYFASFVITPALVSHQFGQKIPEQLSESKSEPGPTIQKKIEEFRETKVPFYELGVEEQIKQSSVIALARYEPAADGKMKAIIKEFLKKEPGTTIYYNIGDEHPSSSYYPKERTTYGDGLIIFFTGSPATMKMSMSFTGDRIHSLGDIPLELFKKKCDE